MLFVGQPVGQARGSRGQLMGRVTLTRGAGSRSKGRREEDEVMRALTDRKGLSSQAEEGNRSVRWQDARQPQGHHEGSAREGGNGNQP